MSPTESPWGLVILCSIPGAVFISLAISRQSPRWWALAGACGLLAAGAFAIDHFVQTDRERVEENVVGVVRAFESGDAERTLDYFSRFADCERAFAAAAVAIVTVEQPLSIKDVSIELTNEDSVAVTTFRVNGTVAVNGRSVGHQASMWRVVWRKEGEQWKITRVQQLDPIHEQPINQLGGLGVPPCG